MPRTSKPIVEVPLRFPEPTGVDSYVVFGLDPSLSRTGHALLIIKPAANWTIAEWESVGSAKPGNTSDPIWVRSKLISLYLRDVVREFVAKRALIGKVGLIVSMEWPTPMNDFLVALNRVLHMILLEEISNFPSTTTGGMPFEFSEIHVLQTNANTLRSLMGLTQRGNKNKAENQAKAHEYLDDSKAFPQLDTDACDAVLLAVMGRFAASILLGKEGEVPQRFKQTLCSNEIVIKGKGRNQRTEIKGLFWNKRYWNTYTKKIYEIMLKNARSPKLRLGRRTYAI